MEKAKVGVVFYISVAILVLAVLVGIFAPDALENMTSNAQSFISTRFGWYYLIVVSLFVLVCLYIIVSPYGKIKLGKPDDKPEYNMATWFAMLFSAGMGIGLVFGEQLNPSITMLQIHLLLKLAQMKQSKRLCVLLFFIGESMRGEYTLSLHYVSLILNSEEMPEEQLAQRLIRL